MPIGIGVNGGLLRQQVLERVSSDKALDSLQQVRTHLSQPGRDSGVLTLFNRTSTRTEMTLERKSGFQLLFHKEDRLDDTVHALKALLKQAGKDEAVAELENYLESQGGNHNRIESRKMLEILNCHLPREAPSLEGLVEMDRIGMSRASGSRSRIVTCRRKPPHWRACTRRPGSRRARNWDAAPMAPPFSSNPAARSRS